MHRRAFLAAVGAAGVGGLAGCSALGAEDGFDVGMGAVAFDPVTVRVGVGEPVVWRNTSARGHTVTAYGDRVPDTGEFFASGGFGSETAARDAFWDRDDGSGADGLLAPGEEYSHAFGIPGEFHYFCVPHEQAGMVGTVVVEE